MERPRYFTPAEVAAHVYLGDLWVSFLGKVVDLSALTGRPEGDALLLPILDAAGTDISHWFDPTTRDVRRYVDPLTSCEGYYTPQGRFLNVPPPGPRSDWDTPLDPPWWRDPALQVGLLTAKSRWIELVNTLTLQRTRLQVCSEDTLDQILLRYQRYNSNAYGYTWRYREAVLDMSKTLSDNGVADDDEELDQLRMDRYIPAILLHFNEDFNDDLTEG
ncbi:cytochrome b5 domain-containing protein 1 [Cololabis saira]|uniref:cytochrome b5 domain-containing protein 1 n=1 Tax=Cololabis saira TaxID=129043 RepID=UPI002AD2B3F5|nr:cytochrome b5 domain-containing protein 1 [Cololabis saira]